MTVADDLEFRCTMCNQRARKRCTGCTEVDKEARVVKHIAFYCTNECQKADWRAHKAPCKAAQAKEYLARAADFLKRVFLAVRAEAFDLGVVGDVAQDEQGGLHFFTVDMNKRGKTSFPLTEHMRGREHLTNMMLSFHAGGDVLEPLVEHVAWAAREYEKLRRKEPSEAKPRHLSFNTPLQVKWSEEVKAMLARKK